MIHDLGLLVSRLAVGLGMAAHGAQKTFGWFEGPGLQGAAQFMGQLGFQPSESYAALASYNEVASGLMVALGLGGPVGPAAMISGMLVAALTVHSSNGFFADKKGVELPALYSAAALALASSGYGALSLDRAIGLDKKIRHPAITALAIGGAIAAGLGAMAARNTDGQRAGGTQTAVSQTA